MRIEWSTLALQTVNFAVLVWLLHRFLYQPVLRMIDARRAGIEQQIAAAAQAQSVAKAQMAAIEADRAGIASERTAALKAAAAEAEVASAARREVAERDATALVAAARKTLADDRGAVLAEARLAALDLGEQIARRLLADVPVKLRTETWLERIVENLTGLSKESLDGLTQQLSEGAVLKVVTASALTPDAAEAWRAQLHRVLRAPIAVTFDVQESLMGGAELHFPQAILRFSWRSALETMRAEIDTRDNAR